MSAAEINDPGVTPPQDEKVKSPVRLPVLMWQADKDTLRDVLCLAAAGSMWDPLQEPNTMSETLVTEEEYLAAIHAAEEVIEEAKKRAPRPKILCHPQLLTAIVIKKLTVVECDAMLATMNDEDKVGGEKSTYLRTVLREKTLWPSPTSPQYEFIVSEVPTAFNHTYPMALMETLGMRNNEGKRVG